MREPSSEYLSKRVESLVGLSVNANGVHAMSDVTPDRSSAAAVEVMPVKHRLWIALNSGVGILLITNLLASVVSIGSNVWASWERTDVAKKQWWEQKDNAFRRLWDLDRELDYRLIAYRETLNHLKEELQPLVKQEKERITPQERPELEAIRQRLARAYAELDSPAHPAYHELGNLGLYALVAQAELAAQERFDSRLSHFNTAKAAIFALRDLNDTIEGVTCFAGVEIAVEAIDELLKRPGLGEWYYKPGINDSPDWHKHLSPLMIGQRE
jgi:hypothetical protein